MASNVPVYFLKRNFRVEVSLGGIEPELSVEFAKAILRCRPSRLDNVLEIEVVHRPDLQIPRIVQHLCDCGMQRFTLRTIYPISTTKIAADPNSYMKYEYQDGVVTDQWTEMSARDDEADDLMIDVLKISFARKSVTDCVWRDDSPTPLTLVPSTEPSSRPTMS